MASSSRLTPEQKAIVRMWIYQVGVDMVACYMNTKNNPNGMTFKDHWSKTDFEKLDEDYYNKRLESGWYDDGFGIRCGKLLRGPYKGKYLTLLDFDSREAFDRFCEIFGNTSIERLAKWTRVEWHGDYESIHVFIISNEEFNQLSGIDGFQVNSTHSKLAFVAPCIYPGGEPYRIYKDINESVAIIDSLDKRKLDAVIEVLVKQITVNKQSYLSDDQRNSHLKWLDDPNTKLGPGARYPNTWIKACSIFFKWKDPEYRDLNDDQRYDKLVEWHNYHCNPSLFSEHGRENDVQNIWNNIVRLNTGKRQEERDNRSEAEEKAKEQARSYAPNMSKRKQDLYATFDDSVRNNLQGDIWTKVSNKPVKLIIARKKQCEICRASIVTKKTTIRSGKNTEVEEYYDVLEYNTTVFKVFPLKATLHENPLPFLDTPTTYTITFEDQGFKHFTLTGSIEYIISKLKERPGAIVSPYAVSEVLLAIIGAMEDDGNLTIDKSVPFEGPYYNPIVDDVILSKINIDEKHPIRTSAEVLTCIEYLDNRIIYQKWKYNNRDIDRTDVYASALQWTVGAPFNFCIKQINGQWQRWWDFSGDKDTAKTSYSKEMLAVHGHKGNSMYSMSIGMADTEAKFAKAIARTTYPIEISEIKTVESYGRNETLVSIFLTAVENLVSRKGRDGNKYDAPFPSLSSVILNGNWAITRKPEVAKRLHITTSTKEDEHSRDPNTPFNLFQSKHGWKIRILGDWTFRYIYEHRKELLLSGKYNTYEISKIAIDAFYRSVGKTVPDWLCQFVPDIAQQELELDDEDIIRSILFDHVNRTLERNSKLIDITANITDSYGRIIPNSGVKDKSLEYRINLCLNNSVWPWIRQNHHNPLEWFIDSSILELFTSRLPNLDLKKLGERMGMAYHQKRGGGRVLKCSKNQLEEFIKGKEIEEVGTCHGNIAKRTEDIRG